MILAFHSVKRRILTVKIFMDLIIGYMEMPLATHPILASFAVLCGRPFTVLLRGRDCKRMATAISGRVALSPGQLVNCKQGISTNRILFLLHLLDLDPSDKLVLYKGQHVTRGLPWAISATGPGKGGILERPTIERTTPGRESEFDLRKSRKTAPPYRVILHNDNFNKREYVVQVLMKVIPGMTLDCAVNVMQEAHYNGLSVVIVCPQADAEEHCMQLRGNGLLSSIEPASGGC
ncbi:hypothetical protein AXF42_Ash008016 [Apostasia shenzhenica]|uniref:Adaptor protein ClpS core domain-containing protein n=1 Tax=Apostasia shenzhenica TaxID=1088818 RepID=A0A2I0A8C2_9ASPA|nr:hypothetical protein AXF42_Ash008016 [Apostasia shenzhenica]